MFNILSLSEYSTASCNYSFQFKRYLFPIKNVHTVNQNTPIIALQQYSLSLPGNTLEVWIKNMRTRYAKLIQTKSGQGARELTARDQWIVETFGFLRPHIVRCPTRTSKVSLFMFPLCFFIINIAVIISSYTLVLVIVKSVPLMPISIKIIKINSK